MPEVKPFTVDFTQENALEPVLPRSPILSSHKAVWDGIFLEYHRQPAHETPEHCLKQHTIGMLIQPRPVVVERGLNERFESLRCAPGDFFVAPANADYSSRCDEETKFIALGLDPTLFARVAYESVNADRVEIVPHLSISDPLIQQIGLLLKTELETSGIGSRLYTESLATALSVHLLRHYCAFEQKIPTYSGGLPKYKLRQAIEFINENLDKEIRLADISTLLDMSQHYFCRQFRQSMGIPPYQYVLQQRMERAKWLLKQQKLSIADIALECGFANQSAFSNAFRKVMGVSPKAYQQKL